MGIEADNFHNEDKYLTGRNVSTSRNFYNLLEIYGFFRLFFCKSHGIIPLFQL
jgi:hypothetical protein